jgi:Aldo/keto reductase family
MEYRQLGRSGLRVSTISMGTMTFGGIRGFSAVGATDISEARKQIDMCLAAGVNLIDTADMYSDGLSEEIVGEVVAGGRDEVLLATKVRASMGGAPMTRVSPATTSSRPVKPAFGGCEPITSTSTSSTDGTVRPHSRRHLTPWTPSSGPGRCAMSGARTSRPGTS